MKRKNVKIRINNVAALLGNAFVPWFIYCFTVSLLCTSIRFAHPTAVAVIVGVAGLILCLLSSGAWKRANRNDDPNAFWLGVFALTIFLAVVAAFIVAEIAFNKFFFSYYAIQAMQSKTEVNPATADGAAMMDVGRAFFAKNTYVSRSQGMSYTHDDVYCVAPITNGPDALSEYDFWAVGMNCCQTQNPDFKCGDYSSTARTGLRAVETAQLPYYQLAVQQASAEYHLASRHPIFFYWVEDANAEHFKNRESAFATLSASMLIHFSCNLAVVLIVTVGSQLF